MKQIKMKHMMVKLLLLTALAPLGYMTEQAPNLTPDMTWNGWTAPRAPKLLMTKMNKQVATSLTDSSAPSAN